MTIPNEMEARSEDAGIVYDRSQYAILTLNPCAGRQSRVQVQCSQSGRDDDGLIDGDGEISQEPRASSQQPAA